MSLDQSSQDLIEGGEKKDRKKFPLKFSLFHLLLVASEFYIGRIDIVISDS